MKNNKYEIDMVNGSIMDKLISFALPLMISGILQLAFNAVDIIVVGQFSGSKSLAAVGSTTALINVFVNLFMGISLGANVLAARFYAAGKDEEMSKTVHTAIMIALISGIVMGVDGVIFARGALEIMGTPDDVIGLSTIYMRIYFCGMPFFMLYNYGAAILRAVGDTKRPLIFLIISGCINALLNLFFVIVCKLDVAGVAIGTIVSQFVSSVLVLYCLSKADTSYKLCFNKLAIDKEYMLTEHSHKYLKCHASVISQFLWLNSHGWIYGGKQYTWLFVCICQLNHTSLHELYKPELCGRKTKENGQGTDRLSVSHDSGSTCDGKCLIHIWNTDTWHIY